MGVSQRAPPSIAHIEAFHRFLEDGLRLYEFEPFAEAYQAAAEFMRYYNEVRLHSSIGYRPMMEYRSSIMSRSEKTSAMSA